MTFGKMTFSKMSFSAQKHHPLKALTDEGESKLDDGQKSESKFSERGLHDTLEKNGTNILKSLATLILKNYFLRSKFML